MEKLLLLSLIITTTIFSTTQFVNVDAQELATGVCYGLLGNNLPQPPVAVSLFKAHNINKVRLFTPDKPVLEALRGSGIKVIVGTLNSDIAVLAQSVAAAQSWFTANIQPYVGSVNITYISVGNEVYPSLSTSGITTAMRNLQGVVDAAGLHGVIKVSTVVSMLVVKDTYPPSNSTFVDPEMVNIVKFLKEQGVDLLANLYPIYPYMGNMNKIQLDYVNFGTTKVVVQDGAFGYTNLLDAMVDSFYWAMEKVGVSDVGVQVTETGWPHGGGNPSLTTVELAATYNTRLVQRLQRGVGTPKRPDINLEAYLFGMFDENLKRVGYERLWGIFKPSGNPNYNPFSD